MYTWRLEEKISHASKGTAGAPFPLILRWAVIWQPVLHGYSQKYTDSQCSLKPAASQPTHSKQSSNLVKLIGHIHRHVRQPPLRATVHPQKQRQRKSVPVLSQRKTFLRGFNTYIRHCIEVLQSFFSHLYLYYTLLSCGSGFWEKELQGTLPSHDANILIYGKENEKLFLLVCVASVLWVMHNLKPLFQ